MMFLAIDTENSSRYETTLKSMFEERKNVFVDLLKWDVPVVADRYEIDQFDDEHAVYLVLLDADGSHQASARLLRTDRPHILDTLYPELCSGAVPKEADIREITRFCLARHLKTRARRTARNMLVTGLAEHALMTGIRSYTGIAEIAWLQQILSFGWDCRPLGLPQRHGSSMLGALRIDVNADTLEMLDRGGVYAPPNFDKTPIRKVA